MPYIFSICLSHPSVQFLNFIDNVPQMRLAVLIHSESVSEATPEEVTIEAAPPTAKTANRGAGTEMAATSGDTAQRPTGRQTREVVIEKIVTEEVML